jgi:hypothetical protein
MDAIEQKIRISLQILEEADLEAVEAKRQADQIIGEDFQDGSPILLLPSFFSVGGVDYQAQVTYEQQQAIQQEALNGDPQAVLDLITDGILAGHMFPAAALVIDILVAALKNQDLSPAGSAAKAQPDVIALAIQPLTKVGGCAFGQNCKENYSATLCESLGGVPVPSCTKPA